MMRAHVQRQKRAWLSKKNHRHGPPPYELEWQRLLRRQKAAAANYQKEVARVTLNMQCLYRGGRVRGHT
eukprot:363677-Prorocentrum_minimum.AAC.1